MAHHRTFLEALSRQCSKGGRGSSQSGGTGVGVGAGGQRADTWTHVNKALGKMLDKVSYCDWLCITSVVQVGGSQLLLPLMRVSQPRLLLLLPLQYEWVRELCVSAGPCQQGTRGNGDSYFFIGFLGSPLTATAMLLPGHSAGAVVFLAVPCKYLVPVPTHHTCSPTRLLSGTTQHSSAPCPVLWHPVPGTDLTCPCTALQVVRYCHIRQTSLYAESEAATAIAAPGVGAGGGAAGRAADRNRNRAAEATVACRGLQQQVGGGGAWTGRGSRWGPVSHKTSCGSQARHSSPARQVPSAPSAPSCALTSASIKAASRSSLTSLIYLPP